LLTRPAAGTNLKECDMALAAFAGAGRSAVGSVPATLSSAALGVGSHTITVSYAGDSNFLSSTSAGLTQTVSQDSSSTTVSASANPSVFGQSVTFTATVSAAAPGAGTATGTVTFKDGATTLGTGTLNGSAQATLSSEIGRAACRERTESYAGDSTFMTSTSAALTQTVRQASSRTTASVAPKPQV